MKQYLLSIYQPDGDPPPADVLAGIMRDVGAVDQEICVSGGVGILGRPAPAEHRDGYPSSEQEGMPMTDGPYVEGKEHIGGLTIIKAADLDEALEWGRKFARATTLPIEVRPFQGELED